MATWDATHESKPAGTDAPSTLDDKIREDRIETRTRIGNEHGNYQNTAEGADGSQTADWVHRKGSGRAYYQSDAPTTRPDGATALDSSGSDDDGRVWISTGTGRSPSVWSGGTWFSVGTNSVIDQNSTGFVLKPKVISIGNWNMDVTRSTTIAHGVSPGRIRAFDAFIRHDTVSNSLKPIAWANDLNILTVGHAGGSIDVSQTDSTSMVLKRRAGGTFDNTGYNATSGFNRGWIWIWYVD